MISDDEGEDKTAIVIVHNIPVEILPCMSMHMMMYFIANAVVAAFAVGFDVATAFAGVLHIT
jgi:hypothetical protein